ncbi:MAG: HypC/HybG/HupF family hydrogenase formation chaperone [Oscillospiraceae bacterium]|nr:HypC/HybG/HupF family hydrogenase formation chaperone [Oscillospiraceae bacterium]
MCIAVVGTVLNVHGDQATVIFQGNILDIEIGLVNAAPGDQVLIHAGCAIQKVGPEEANSINSVYLEIMEAVNESGG